LETAVFNGVRLSGALFQTISKSPVLGIREIVAGARERLSPEVLPLSRTSHFRHYVFQQGEPSRTERRRVA
jgi:hypothetical protein